MDIEALALDIEVLALDIEVLVLDIEVLVLDIEMLVPDILCYTYCSDMQHSVKVLALYLPFYKTLK
jgi:hypothetical protein